MKHRLLPALPGDPIFTIFESLSWTPHCKTAIESLPNFYFFL